ncbi:MAG TPA: cytochrome b [Allosphingosinicella sp.]|nr:cytochrome b [Allosphingosinicella sp.]
MATAGIGNLNAAHYSRVAILLHWIIAILVLTNLYLGIFHEDMSKPVRASMLFYHKAIGLTVLALTLLRLAWRLGHRPPPYDAAMKRWEVGLARATHWTFYFMLIALPLSGWLLISTGGKPVSWFGLFNVPALPIARGDDAHDLWDTVHVFLGWTMLVLVALHILGALKHLLQGQRQILGRMAPFVYRAR